MRANSLKKGEGLAFYAKDADTLVRGLSYLSKHAPNQMAYLVRSGDGSGLSLWGSSWERERGFRGFNIFTAGISSAGHNVLEFGKRAIATLLLTFENLDRRDIKAIDSELYYAMHKSSVREYSEFFNIQRYVDFKSVLDQFSRDGKLANRGAFLYVCRKDEMPRHVNCGVVEHQIPSILGMGELAVKARQMFFGAKPHFTPKNMPQGTRDGGIFN